MLQSKQTQQSTTQSPQLCTLTRVQSGWTPDVSLAAGHLLALLLLQLPLVELELLALEDVAIGTAALPRPR